MRRKEEGKKRQATRRTAACCSAGNRGEMSAYKLTSRLQGAAGRCSAENAGIRGSKSNDWVANWEEREI